MKKLGAVFLFLSISLISLSSISYAAPIEAHAVYVEGEVNYVSIEDSAQHPVEVNTPFREGDRVMTGSDGKVEIEFDTGALLLLDNDTDMTIKSLNRSDQGAISAIFDLAVGLIKSSFNKLADGDTVEYHTKTAISGIAGTPEHAIQVDVTAEGVDRTNVYVFGEAGDEGSLFVRGFDPGKTEVTLFAGQGTTILAGLAPVIPFLFGPEILQSLGHMLFHTGGGAAGGAGGAATTTATTATTAGVSGTTMAVVGGVAVVGGAAAASGGGGGGGSSTPATETTTPAAPTATPTATPTAPTAEPETGSDELSGTWSGALVWGSPSGCTESGDSFPLSCSITQSADSLNGNCIADGDSFTIQGNRSGDGWTVSASLPGEGGSGSLTGSISGVSGNTMSGTWQAQGFCNDGIEGSEDTIVPITGSWSATKQ